MQFRTQITIQKTKSPIDYHSKMVSIGSCFAENMAQKFDYFKFQNIANPFGIMFNVISIENIIDRIVANKLFAEKDIFFHNDAWHCFEVHSCLSHPDKDIYIDQLNLILLQTKGYFSDATHFIFTFGTSWIYRNVANNQVVANCHKMAQSHFKKELISIEATLKSIENIILMITSINPKANFIFTVSPVRHIKDGFFENNVSKGILHQAFFSVLHSQELRGAKNNIEIFPSFEIIMDELRDYRFFEVDMLHPNQIAIDYVWQQFVSSNINSNTQIVLKKVEAIQKMLSHRSINSNAKSTKKLQQKIQIDVQLLNSSNPEIIF